MKAHQSTNSLLTSETLQLPHSTMVDAVCSTHGPYTATVRVWEPGVGFKPLTMTSPCPGCTEAERVAREAEEKSAQDEMRRSRMFELMSHSGIPARFAHRTFDNFVATEHGQKIALSVCRAYASKWPEKRRQGASLVLTGLPGTGKTHLACAIAHEVITHHLRPVLFCSVSSMLRSIKQTYSKDSEINEQEMIDQFADVSLLIVDEVGIQVGSEHEKVLMFEIFNERYQSMRPTILISNLSIKDLEKFLGERIMDRYRECGSVLAFNWPSHRGKQVERA